MLDFHSGALEKSLCSYSPFGNGRSDGTTCGVPASLSYAVDPAIHLAFDLLGRSYDEIFPLLTLTKTSEL